MPFSNERFRGTIQFRGKEIDQAFTRVINEANREIKIMTLGADELHLFRPPLEAAAQRGVSLKALVCAELGDPAAFDKCTRTYEAFRDIAEVRHLDPSHYPEHEEQVKQNGPAG